MNSRRTIILVVAILMAALAALGLITYVNGLEENVYKGQELVNVWQVQAESIPKGTQGDDLVERGLIIEKQIPVEFRPSAVITNPGEELTGLVAVSDSNAGRHS